MAQHELVKLLLGTQILTSLPPLEMLYRINGFIVMYGWPASKICYATAQLAGTLYEPNMVLLN
jgi:hypothetical protein